MSDKNEKPDVDPKLVSDALKARYVMQNILGVWDTYVESLALWARAQKARFDALLKEGFSSDQALELVKENIQKTGGY